MAAFDALYHDVASDGVFIELLKQEGQTAADDTLYAAQKQVMALLLKTGCETARTFWNAKNYDAAVSILESVSESEFEEDLVNRALRDFAAVGDREAEALRTPPKDYSWYPDRQGYDLAPARRLIRLADVLETSVPATANWRTKVEQYVAAIAAGIWKYANDAFTRGELVEAKNALTFLLAEPLAAEYHAEAAKVAAFLDQTEKETKRQAARQETAKREAAKKTPPQKPIPPPIPTPTPKDSGKGFGALFGTLCLMLSLSIFGTWLYLTSRTPSITTTSPSGTTSPNVTPEPTLSFQSVEEPSPLPKMADSNAERRERLEGELKEINDRLGSMKNGIDSERNIIDGQESEIVSERNAIEMKRPAVDLSDEAQVDSFNERIGEVRQKSRKFNARVREFNDAVNNYNARLNRVREIKSALREMENL